jgi:hypothetical protein
MMASRGMGAVNPSKMPGAKKKARRDNTDFTQYAEGGEVKPAAKIDGNEFVLAAQKYGLDDLDENLLNKIVNLVNQGKSVDKAAKQVRDEEAKRYAAGGKVKSKVNESGNYTKPELRKRIFNSVKAAAVQGTGAGQWSARKAQLMAKRYKAAGGGYK